MIKIPYYETSNFCFSNFSAHAVNFQGYEYPTAEHAFHAQKFHDVDLQSKIKNCKSPLSAYSLAKKLKSHRRKDWDNVKVDILTEIIRAKLAQNQDVKAALIATGKEEIIEINPDDDFWGNGPDGNGQNHMGKILMRIREELS